MSSALRFVAVMGCTLLGCRGIADVSTSLDVRVSVDRSVASVAAPVEITVRVVNRGAYTIQTVEPRQYGCPGPFLVYNGAGTLVPPAVRFCSLPLYAPVLLAPGDSVVIRDRWSGDTAGESGRSMAVPAGLYRIVGRVYADNREIISTAVAVDIN